MKSHSNELLVDVSLNMSAPPFPFGAVLFMNFPLILLLFARSKKIIAPPCAFAVLYLKSLLNVLLCVWLKKNIPPPFTPSLYLKILSNMLFVVRSWNSNAPPLTSCALFLMNSDLNVLFFTRFLKYMAPPSRSAMFSLKVPRIRVFSTGPSKYIAPPRIAELFMKTESIKLSTVDDSMYIAPPLVALLFLKLQSIMSKLLLLE